MSVTPFTVAAQSWVYSTTITAADPGQGFMRFSHAALASATSIYLDDLDVNGIDRGAGLAILGAGDVVRVQKADDATRWEQFVLTGSAVDSTGWFRLPVIRTIGSSPKLTLANGDVLLLTVFAPGEAGFETSYAQVDELARILQITSPTTAQTIAMERVLDAAAAEINSFLGVPLPLAAPYPSLVIQVNLERAVEHWKQEQSPFGIINLGGEAGPAYTSRNSWKRHAQTLLPLKQTWGVG